jgi:hypothetical protein
LNQNPDGPVRSNGVANYWGDQTGLNSDEATVGSSSSPFQQGYGKYALAVIGGTKPARTHIPIQTSAAAHGVGKPWFTSAKKLRTRTSGETETSDLANIRSTGRLNVNSGWTDKFLFPPHDFKIANCMITNFHPPESTLLMLSAAFAGHDELMEAYNEAIKKKYKFMAYGDALLII